jgi:cyclophilin family peptidyl-prolyl cis-trans isomerase/HEAT repeat protein
MKHLTVIIVLLLSFSCTRKDTNLNKYSDSVVLAIAELQDKRNTDSLLLLLSHENTYYRKEAALAFASLQDSASVKDLANVLLKDNEAEVRAASAFSLGQTSCLQTQVALTNALANEKEGVVIREVLMALGKTLSKEKMKILTAYTPITKDAEEGKAWGLYRLGIRSITDSLVVQSIYPFLASVNESTRMAAAHFFARVTLQNFIDKENLLKNAANDTSILVRIAATQGLRNVKTDSSRRVVQHNAKDADERVRVSAIRALRTFTFSEVADTFFEALNDSSLQVRVAAAEALTTIASKEFSLKIEQAAAKAKDWRVQATLYETVVIIDPKQSTFESIKQKYEAATNAYQKAALLSVLGRSAANYPFVGSELISNTDPIILSSAALSLTACNSASDFSEKEKTGFLKFYQQAIAKGDAAVTGIIAQLLGDSTKKYKAIIKDARFLKDARNKLSLPKDNEAIQPIEAAIAYFENRKPVEVKNEFNHPIDWSLVKTISANQTAVIKTTKGDITLTLFVNEAPGSVANFVMLTKQHYFDNKFFHRVVPNFVIQAGCNRGDGWGSEDYSIRSEFTKRVYKGGSVGMASAGKDTEGTQWFITHSPTPHLDGRYSIFAEVTQGLQVVNAIGVGDKILSIELQ